MKNCEGGSGNYKSLSAEKLFEFLVGHKRYLRELRDDGPVDGVQAQFWENEGFRFSRRFDTRAQAIQWAQWNGRLLHARRDGASNSSSARRLD